MSLIFDALQRSEEERTGADLSRLPAATELLQRFEKQTLQEWEAAVHPTPVSIAGQDPLSVVEAGRNDKHLELITRFPSLPVSPLPHNQLVSFEDNESLVAEKFRFLGVRLRHLRRERPLQKVLITSTIPHEGKSMVSANLACILARKAEQRTLLVEGDLRRPALAQMFGLGKLPGICEWLQGRQNQITDIYHLEGPNIWMLPAGNIAGNALEFLQSARLPLLMEQLSALFDWVIIDSPPVLPLADTSVWSRLADGILLVTRQGTTTKKQLQKGLEVIDQKKVIGALLNCSHSAAHSENYYYSSPADTPSA